MSAVCGRLVAHDTACCTWILQRFKQDLTAHVKPGTEFFDGVPNGEPALLSKEECPCLAEAAAG